ncbi:MAG: hypothetical protein OEW15_18360 [Nitrospirota bacterium]|nr:hypothetical protein [Nitrospirota bacterium]
MKKFWMLISLVLIAPVSSHSATASDYLIVQDIGQYMFMGKGGGHGSGVLAATGHFSKDHVDESYGGMYFNEPAEIGVNVEVTKHTDPADSIKWLLHEVDKGFRTSLGIPGESYGPRVIDGHTIMDFGAGGREYRWLSGNKVIRIEYTDLQMEKPEPIEVVKAYLAKHPSTLAPITLKQLRSTENITTWIKDEMDRRLWLCDKWFMQLQLRKIEDKEVYQQAVKSMNIFLDYREKYYRTEAVDEKNLIAVYLDTNNGTGIKTKLKEYKEWWAVNKEKSITL